jgi:glucose-1-phosphate cytidylyltransferase
VKTLILCGGKGTRAYPHTVDVPKPLLEVAGVPILEHVMRIYAEQGHVEFVLAAGYLGEAIRSFAATLPAAWDVQVVDTGLETNTAGRVAMCRRLLGETFFVTYGDGLGDVDLDAVLAVHRGHQRAATITTVPLRSQYGTVQFARSGRVERFLEKPVLEGHWINAGFFVFEQRAFECWRGDDLERDVLPGLAAAGQLYAYRHHGFWRSMDTYKDALELTALCGEDGSTQWNTPFVTSPYLLRARPASSARI